MSEQDHDTPETNDEQHDTTEYGQMNTGDGAVEQQTERRGEQAAEDTQQTAQEQTNTAEASAVEASSTEEKPAEQKPEEAEDPEDLFDLLGEEGKKHKKKKPEPQQGAKQGQSAGQQKKEEKKFPAQAEIVYAGHRITVPREMSGSEIIDELLADDFPELTKDSTEFTHDEARNRIVPTRKALKKGAHGLRRERGGSRRLSAATGVDDEPPSLTVHTHPHNRPLPPVHRVLAHDGVYEVRDTSLGTFTARIPGEVSVTEGFSLKIPKAPVELLEATVRIFKERPDREVLLTIMYDRRDARHHLAWPEQSATATSIDYDSITEDEDLIVYAEIHSHNSMDPFFSATDDTSEARSTGLYGVIGRIDLDRPHAAFRYSCGHHFRRISGSSLFDDPARVRKLLAEVPA